MSFKPLLASAVDFRHLDFDNLLISPKIDGIRAIVINGVVMSRSLKPIPNKHVQWLFGRLENNFIDGELVCGAPTEPDCCRKTSSAVMSIDGEPPVTFHAFDHVEYPYLEYQKRLTKLNYLKASHGFQVVPQFIIKNEEEMSRFENTFLSEGYEGAMLRAYWGEASYYKFGRATAKSGTLLKLKRFETDEAEIIGFDEEMQNNNEAVIDALGHTKRSSHQENKAGKGRLGALVCRTKDGVEFRIGSGFTFAQRQEIWDTRESLLGKQAGFKYLSVGIKEAPRHPVYRGIRDERDL